MTLSFFPESEAISWKTEHPELVEGYYNKIPFIDKKSELPRF